jgi:hypothetical protein
MLKLYFATSIDKNPDRAKELIEWFKGIISKFPFIEVYGAGFKDSPIIDPYHSTHSTQRIITAYDFRQLRECDCILFVTDGKTFAAGSLMELEHARQLGLMIIVYCMSKVMPNIFITSLADLVLYEEKTLIDILGEISNALHTN